MSSSKLKQLQTIKTGKQTLHNWQTQMEEQPEHHSSKEVDQVDSGWSTPASNKTIFRSAQVVPLTSNTNSTQPSSSYEQSYTTGHIRVLFESQMHLTRDTVLYAHVVVLYKGITFMVATEPALNEWLHYLIRLGDTLKYHFYVRNVDRTSHQTFLPMVLDAILTYGKEVQLPSKVVLVGAAVDTSSPEENAWAGMVGVDLGITLRQAAIYCALIALVSIIYSLTFAA